MSNQQLANKNSELFTEVAEKDQADVFGGYDLIIQQTNINTSGFSDLLILDGDTKYYSSARTDYSLSQLTIAVDFSSLLGSNRRGRRSIGPLISLFRMLSFF
ncbi:hypothetical protein [Nostoc sp. CCY0012]|uniref:hypothetical protein n=1 Tax=Nostoc sp. CCY0012 TaxID=1056123 RepID=UPI0039C680BC